MFCLRTSWTRRNEHELSGGRALEERAGGCARMLALRCPLTLQSVEHLMVCVGTDEGAEATEGRKGRRVRLVHRTDVALRPKDAHQVLV